MTRPDVAAPWNQETARLVLDSLVTGSEADPHAKIDNMRPDELRDVLRLAVDALRLADDAVRELQAENERLRGLMRDQIVDPGY